MLRKLVFFGEIGPPLFSAFPLLPASDATWTYAILPNILLRGLRILICQRQMEVWRSRNCAKKDLLAAAVADVRTDLATFRVPWWEARARKHTHTHIHLVYPNVNDSFVSLHRIHLPLSICFIRFMSIHGSFHLFMYSMPIRRSFCLYLYGRYSLGVVLASPRWSWCYWTGMAYTHAPTHTHTHRWRESSIRTKPQQVEFCGDREKAIIGMCVFVSICGHHWCVCVCLCIKGCLCVFV
jgi:hypothetical protein